MIRKILNQNDKSNLGRRDFIKASIAVGAISQTLISESFCQTKDDGPDFTFLHLNDTHLAGQIENNGVYASANIRLRWFIEHMNKSREIKPEFMLYLGDMVNGVKLENLKPEIEELKEEVIDKLPFKVYPCIGNHENKQRQGSPEYNKAYIDTFGKDRIDYVFQQGKIQFVVFDNSGMPPRPSIKMEKEHEELRKQKLIWLRKVFEANPEKNKILCCHIPLACVREEEVLAKSFGFPSYYVHDEEMLALLREYNDSVLAVLSGHLHLTGMKKIDGIHHIVASGLASYPHDFGIYYVYRDRIDVRMRSVPESMHEPYASNIHNRRRHGIDYTNKAHPTHEQYVKGNADERAFSIPFKIL